MTSAEGQAWTRIAHHLAGSLMSETAELADDVTLLIEAAATATGVQGSLDVDAILEALGHVEAWHTTEGRT